MPPRPLRTVPARCLEQHPTAQTVYFAGTAINLTKLQRALDYSLDHSYLSLIFAGKRTPSTATARLLAGALGMRIEPFLEALDKAQEASVFSQSA